MIIKLTRTCTNGKIVTTENCLISKHLHLKKRCIELWFLEWNRTIPQVRNLLPFVWFCQKQEILKILSLEILHWLLKAEYA